MVLPEYVVREYYSRVDGARYDRGQGGWVFACDVTLPDFAFGVGGDGAGNGESDSGEGQHVITIPGWYLNTGPVEDDGMAVDGTSTGGQICGGGIQSLGGHVVSGAVALKAGIAVFDARKDGERLGWANKTLTL
jgi:aspergillopepsin I